MNERLKTVRQYLKLTQEEFGKKLGVTRSAISYLESGRNKITEQMLFLICVTFDIRKEWLETGDGNMLMTHSADEEFWIYLRKMQDVKDPEKRKYALLFLKLIIDEWELVESGIGKITKTLSWISSRPEDGDEFPFPPFD